MKASDEVHPQVVEQFAFANRLRLERRRIGKTQPALAEACGVQRRTQHSYEAGARSPNGNYLMRAAAAGIDVLYVVTGRREPMSDSSPTGPERAPLEPQHQSLVPHPERIRAELRIKGVTFASLADELGLSMASVRNAVRGRGKSSRIANRISEILGVPVNTLWPGAYSKVSPMRRMRRDVGPAQPDQPRS